MTTPEGQTPQEAEQQVNELLDSPVLTKAVETEEFRVFLDHIPIAIVVSKLVLGDQRVVYANKEYERLVGKTCAEIEGRGWSILNAFFDVENPSISLTEVLPKSDDFVGTFKRDGTTPLMVELYSSVIECEESGKTYQVVALIDVTERQAARQDELRQLREKDLLLKELQHRVKNNLQLITALIRLDAKNQRRGDVVNLDRLASRIEALQLLYRDLTPEGLGETVDLGHYVSQVASSAMHTYGVDGIRLDLKVDHAPVSINVAMPIGLLVNELLTNAFKYAFAGRESGLITVRCLHEAEHRYRIVVADDGMGLPPPATWPVPGKLGALILQSLRENAKTDFNISTGPGLGLRATIDVMHTPKIVRSN